MTRRLAAFAFSLACTAAAAQSMPAPPLLDRDQLERRLTAVDTLIERSSAAKQIESSAVPAALQLRERARATHREANDAFRAGDFARASAVLPRASVFMFEAVRLAAPEQVTGAKRRTDFDSRLESARSLAAAQRRIAAEKPYPNAAETTRAIEAFLGRAEEEARGGRMEQATLAVEQGYLLAKAAIGSMRDGDTLVRSLSFASKEEEYRYEVDRNDTHRMLLKVLLDQAKTERVAGYMDKAGALRSQADGAAAAGDYPAAIRMLEDSTRELVRAIRMSGVYFPG